MTEKRPVAADTGGAREDSYTSAWFIDNHSTKPAYQTLHYVYSDKTPYA